MVNFNISWQKGNQKKQQSYSCKIRSNIGFFTGYTLLYWDLPSVQSLIIFISQLYNEKDEKDLKQFYLLPQELLWMLLQILSLHVRATWHNGAIPCFKLMYKTCTMCLFSQKHAAPDLIQTFLKWSSLLGKTAYDAELKRQQPLQNFCPVPSQNCLY